MIANAMRKTAPKVLVVDDVEANRTVLCRRLEGTGYELHAVDTGERALQFIEDEKPDLVLLDYMMPRMNGIEVLRIIRQEWRMVELPIIMLTARAEAEAVVTALEAGADDYISKPIDFEVLKARIENQLNKVKSNDSLRQANAALDERVAMRVLAFDQLREELEREIMLRKRAEFDLQSQKAAAATDAGIPAGMIDQLEKAERIVDTVIGAAAAGKPTNLALLNALKASLAALRSGSAIIGI